MILVALYISFISIAGFRVRKKNATLRHNLEEGENHYRKKLAHYLEQLQISEKKDELLTIMTELKMVEELGQDAASRSDDEELQRLLVYAEGLEKEMGKIRSELEKKAAKEEI